MCRSNVLWFKTCICHFLYYKIVIFFTFASWSRETPGKFSWNYWKKKFLAIKIGKLVMSCLMIDDFVWFILFSFCIIYDMYPSICSYHVITGSREGEWTVEEELEELGVEISSRHIGMTVPYFIPNLSLTRSSLLKGFIPIVFLRHSLAFPLCIHQDCFVRSLVEGKRSLGECQLGSET